ncbi:hypothetical protein D3C84_1056410 [compost metagenome]
MVRQQLPGQLIDGRTDACTDMIDRITAARYSSNKCRDDILNVDEVACLIAVAMDGQRPPFQKAAQEQRDDIAFPLGHLERAVYIGEPKNRRL